MRVHLKGYADGCKARAGIGVLTTLPNARRPYQALASQTPMTAGRADVDPNEAAAKAVDMTLRLDNANALPTYPQQRQKQKVKAGQGLFVKEELEELHLKTLGSWSRKWGPFPFASVALDSFRNELSGVDQTGSTPTSCSMVQGTSWVGRGVRASSRLS